VNAAKPAAIDFARYRMPELADALSGLIDLRGIYVRSTIKVRASAGFTTVLCAVGSWSVGNGRITTSVLGPALVAGCLARGLFACAEVVRHRLSGMLCAVSRSLD
jgi:hypothetical protein